jgi:2-C-methyl-D-erythritol 2,4-cyclodiphosphate synthase
VTRLRIGHGFDTHALVPDRPLVLGGIVIPHDRGLEGHSDGDVLLHSVTSALLGAMGEGDLGTHFPSSDPALRGIASRELVARAVSIMRDRGFVVGNLDTTLVAQAPRLAPHLDKMRSLIADLLDTPAERINVKATSTDHLGHLGRGEGIAAFAVVLLEPSS